MELNVYGKRSVSGISSSIIELNGPLVMPGDPLLNSHAANKGYIDTFFSGIPYSKITSGVVPVNKMPPIGSGLGTVGSFWSVSLPDRADITPGLYPKHTIDAKGLSTKGEMLSEADLPPVPFSKITTGKPNLSTTLGITDAVKASDNLTVDSFTNTSWVSPRTDSAIDKKTGVVKSEVDYLKANSKSIYKTGDILIYPEGVTPEGGTGYWLRCNGAEVNKADYPALSQEIGDKYSKIDAGVQFGKPWMYTVTTNQNIGSSFNNSALDGVFKGQTGVLNPIALKLPEPLSSFGCFVSKNKLYILGGSKSYGNLSNKTYYSPIDPVTGNLGAWVQGPDLYIRAQVDDVVVVRDKVYMMIGSYQETEGGTLWVSNFGLCGILDSEGLLISTSVDGSLFRPPPVCYEKSGMHVIDGKLYSFGGRYSGAEYVSKKIQSALISKDGTLGSWGVSGYLPVKMTETEVVLTNRRITILSAQYEPGTNYLRSKTNWVTGISYSGPSFVDKKNESISGEFDSSYGWASYNENVTYPAGGGLKGCRLRDTGKVVIVHDHSLSPGGPNQDNVVIVGGLDPVTNIASNKILLGFMSNHVTDEATFFFQNPEDAFLSMSEATSGQRCVGVKNFIYAMGGTLQNNTNTDNIYAIPFLGTETDFTPVFNRVKGASSPSKFLLPDFTDGYEGEYVHYIKI